MTINYRVLLGEGHPGRSVSTAELAELYRHPTTGNRPWVRTNFVSTLDGAAQGPDGRSGSINTASDRMVFALQRAMADVIMVGAGTARVEHYRAVDLEPWQHELRAEFGMTPDPTLAIVSRSCGLPADLGTASDQVPGGPVLILTGGGSEGRSAPDGTELVEIGDDDLVGAADLINVLAERGLYRVLCEGGPHLSQELHAAGLVDEICLTLSPLVIGGDASRTTAGTMLDPESYDLAHCITADDQSLLLRYTRSRQQVVGP
ncbi:dihydrofolate reductase family protein [Microlunatus soli]|uniref:Pyrimidine reductase, riboflavin biosynthesis n=1 Tax=Microlunatus soli TaxID=630515 RepID=A0A1H2AQ30_9ACTN|nr:dihydrofolate reductase family protein [Microlunatus soli]SDT48070.1 Pyrimidine reductase, riboflavin biosynthesis [Microlunatus soli]